MYLIKITLQIILFFTLFLITHFVMSQEDVFSTTSFFDLFEILLVSSFSISAACVLLIQLPILFSHRLLAHTIGFFLGFLQIYFNYNYLEYYIVFKVPLYGKDIIYMNDPSALWELSKGSILNIRFVYFILIPSLLLFLTIYPKRNYVSFTKKIISFTFILTIGLTFGLGVYFIYSKNLKDNRVVLKGNKVAYTGYIRNPLIVTYEEIANYLQHKKAFSVPDSLDPIREIFPKQEKRVFTQNDFPLMQESSSFKSSTSEEQTLPPQTSPPLRKNLIILMFESLPTAEIYAISKYPPYRGTSPFFQKIIKKSILFENTYSSGIHTYFGFNDLFTGVANFEYMSWNKKVNLNYPFSLPQILKDNGYQKMVWYYGGGPFFDNMASFAAKLKFTQSFFLNRFPKQAKRSNWGISDREVFLKAAQDIKKMKEPFFSFVLGLSKHGPWSIPPDFDHKGFEEDYLKKHATNLEMTKDGIRNSKKLTYYANQVLREFFKTMEDDPKFKNSIVIITSDQAFFPDIKSDNFFKNLNHGFKIPLIYYEAGITPGKIKTFASHLDIIPTLINRLSLKIPDQVPYMGKDLFNPIYAEEPDAHANISFWNGTMLHFKKDKIYQKTIDSSLVPRFYDPNGLSHTSKDDTVNFMFESYQNIYRYLVDRNLVFENQD